ncbi:PIN domain-containing protein [Candidatus Pacearchaeota archaeon]|nr:PIN domain-containing protein [Candidatus Pacearchaeota archaeon]
MEISYFFDSYAVIEILKENQNYSKYIEEETTITVFNLAEIYWYVQNNFDEKTSDIVFEQYKDSVVNIDDETLKEAVKFRKEYKKKDLSYADCIGYVYALRNNMKFLTGDKEFEGMKNVEFVK